MKRTFSYTRKESRDRGKGWDTVEVSEGFETESASKAFDELNSLIKRVNKTVKEQLQDKEIDLSLD